jgi:hypothetical protein
VCEANPGGSDLFDEAAILVVLLLGDGPPEIEPDPDATVHFMQVGTCRSENPAPASIENERGRPAPPPVGYPRTNR